MVNSSSLALALSGASSSVTGQDVANQSGIGLTATCDVTAIAGTAPTVVFTVEGKDPISGKYRTLIESASVSSVSTVVMRVYPGIAVAANVTANDVISGTIRVRATIAGTGPSVTATVGVTFHG